MSSESSASSVLAALEQATGRPLGALTIAAGASAALGHNERAFTVPVTFASSDTVQSFLLHTHAAVLHQASGFLSADIVGPLEISMVGKFGTGTAYSAMILAVIVPDDWDTPKKLEHMVHCSTRAKMQYNIAAADASISLPLPDLYKTNVRAIQSIGERARIAVHVSFSGFSSITVMISGKLLCQGARTVQPYTVD